MFCETGRHYLCFTMTMQFKLKKLLKVISIVLGLFFILLLTAPFLFKGKIVAAIKKSANAQLNATLDFDPDISISLIRSFPKLSVGINKLSILGKDSFAGDTLVYLPELRVSMDLMSAIRGEEINIRTVKMSRPRINLETLPSGRANWDIMKPDSAKPAPTDTVGGKFKMALKSLVIEQGHITYNDRSMGFLTDLWNVDHKSSGDFSQDNFTLKTHTETPSLTLGYGGVNWLYNIKTILDADLGMDMKAMKFTFKDAKAKLNELDIQSDGFVDLNENDMDMDISFKALQNSFRNFLSLVPGMYSSSFKDVKAAGTLALQGSMKGKMTDTRMPATHVALQIANASFRYPNLPYPADNIQVDLKFDNPDGEPDHSVLDISKFSLNLANEPFDMKLLLKTPVSDPFINTRILGNLDLSKIAGLVPLEKGTTLAGLLRADLSATGNYSAATGQNYSRLDAKGNLNIKNFKWQLPTDKEATELQELALDFTPKQVNMPVCRGHLGKNDFDASGSLTNLLGYMFADETLSGNLKLKSQYINANSFMSDAPVAEEPKPTDSAQASIVEIPGNLDISVQADIDKLVYDNLVLTNVSGSVRAVNAALQMNKLKAGILGGTVEVNGKYDSRNVKNPFTELNTRIAGMNLSNCVDYFPMMKKYAPAAKHIKGLFNASIDMNSMLDAHMQPTYNSMNVNGTLSFTDAAVESLDALKQIGKQMNIAWMDKLQLKNQTLKFKIQEGVFSLVDSLNIPLPNGATMRLSGRSKLDQTLAYGGWIKIPRTALGAANNVLNGWIKQAASKGLDLNKTDQIPVDFTIGGTFTKPEVRVSLKGFAQSVGDAVKDKAKEEANKKLQEALEKARKQADELKAEAKKQADKIREEAKTNADKLRGEGKLRANQIRVEGDKAAKKITDEANAQISALEAKANDPLSKAAAKKAGDKLRSEAAKKAEAAKGEFYLRARQTEDEANKAAGKIESEANNRADKLEKEASDNADKLLKDAESKAKV